MVDSFVLESEKYQIVRELGRGGMGVVYLAEDVLLRRTVALKVLYEHLNRDSSFVKRFQKEAQAVSSLRHPNIVFVHGAEVVGRTFLIDMEFVDGLSLGKFSESTKIAPPIVARIACDLLNGLAACHATGVIHRDIKPANILLDQAGVAKIADFGLATAYAGHLTDSVKSKSTSGFFMGTPRYAPPAAWDGLDPKPEWDLYSLGVVLYELLTGQVAYPGETPMAIMRQHLTSPLPPLKNTAAGISKELAELVDSLVDCSPNRSTPTAAGALDSLQLTPEYKAVKDGETARTVKVAIRKKRIRHAGLKTAILSRKLLYAAAIAALSGATALWLANPEPTPAASTAAQSDPASLFQGPVTFMRPESVGGSDAEGALWMFSPESDREGGAIVSLAELGLEYMYLTPREGADRFDVSGGWGEYLAPAGRSFRYGTIAGEALLDRSANSMTLSITRTNSRDGADTSVVLVARGAVDTLNEEEYISRLESSEPLQYMLYHELMPRQLEWAAAIEALMPAFENGRLAVPSADTAIVVDGILDDTTWTQGFDVGPSEAIRLESASNTVSARWSETALVLAFSAASGANAGTLELVLSPGPLAPNGPVRRFKALIERNTVSESRLELGTLETPWQCDWEVATTIWRDQWNAEIRIPLSEFSTLGIPDSQRRWRLSAMLREPETGREIARWGSGLTDEVEHGIVLTFKELSL